MDTPPRRSDGQRQPPHRQQQAQTSSSPIIKRRKEDPGAGTTVINNFFENCPLHLGPSCGNTANYYGPKVRLKVSGPPELLDELCHKLGNDNSQMSLKEVVKECDSDLIGVKKGCVELTLNVRSLEGLEKLWTMYSTLELQERLKRDLPVNTVQISEDDYQQAREFFKKQAIRKAALKTKLEEKVNHFELATTEYVRCRKKTVALLRDLVDYINRRKRIAQAAAVTGAAGFVLALLTLGSSLALPAASAGVVTFLGAVVVQGVTAKISTDSAKKAMEADKNACCKVHAALEEVDAKLKAWKEAEKRVIIDSIYELVRVDLMDLQRGAEVVDTIGKHGEEIVTFFFIKIALEAILVHVLDIFRNDVSKMAQKMSDLADKLDCPQEEMMKRLILKLRERLQAFDANY